MYHRVRIIPAGALAITSSCLPVDTRPPPATVFITVRGSAEIRNGIPAAAVDDGWSITFDRFLVSLGKVMLEGDPCTPYSDADYTRLFDGRTLEPQKLSVLYGLGDCALSFRVLNPDEQSVVSLGVTETDKTLMRTAGDDEFNTASGVSVHVRGRATKDSVTKTFAWSWRMGFVTYTNCKTVFGGEPLKLALTGEVYQTVDLTLRGGVLFRDHLDPELAKLRFGAYAHADDRGDANGDVTLGELADVTLADAGLGPDSLVVPGQTTPAWTSLSEYLYLGLFPQVVGLDEVGTCTVALAKEEE